MISSVSGISFRGEAPASTIDLINSPGKYSTPEAKSDVQGDSFASKTEKKKSNTGTVIGTIVALLAAAYIGLGVAVNKGKFKKIDNPEGIIQKTKNFFHNVGESADNLWKRVRGQKTEGKPETQKPEVETK